MTPTNEDFKMFQGNTKKITFQTTGITSISDVNNIEWNLVSSNNQDEPIVQKVYPADISIEETTIDEETVHLISFVLVEADTIDLEPRKYIHELKLEDTDTTTSTDYATTISRGELRLVKSIIS